MPRWNVHFALTVNMGDPELLQWLAVAKALSRTVRGIPVPPYVDRRLHTLNIVRAVRGTTGIEGTELSEEEVEEILESPDKTVLPGRKREEQEVRNAEKLMRVVEATLTSEPDLPLSEEIICKFHEILTADIQYDHNLPGKYRSFPVHAGSYQAPDSNEEVRNLMQGFIRWFRSAEAKKLDPVIKAIVAHFLLVSIHPYGDGNGRTSRAVESFLLYQAGVNARGFYSLANYYYEHRSDYVRHLDYVRFVSDPDVTPFVKFGLYGLARELETVQDELLAQVQVISFRDYAREQLESAGRLGTKTGERQLMFLLELGGQRVHVRDLRAGKHRLAHYYKGVTAKTLSRDLNALEELKLVVVEKGVLRANIELMDQFTAVKAPIARLLDSAERRRIEEEAQKKAGQAEQLRLGIK